MKILLILTIAFGIGYIGYRIGTVIGLYETTRTFVRAEGGDPEAKKAVDDFIDITCKLGLAILMFKAKFGIK